MPCVMNRRVTAVVDGAVSGAVSGDGAPICMGVWGARVTCEMVCFAMSNLTFGTPLGVVPTSYNITKH